MTYLDLDLDLTEPPPSDSSPHSWARSALAPLVERVAGLADELADVLVGHPGAGRGDGRVDGRLGLVVSAVATN
jgi:hypothetical protein